MRVPLTGRPPLRLTASLAFLGGAIAPYLAGKLSEIYNSSVPFYVGAAFVFLSVLFIWWNTKHIQHVDAAEGGINPRKIKD